MGFLFFCIMFCIIVSGIAIMSEKIRKNRMERAKRLREYEEEQKKKKEEKEINDLKKQYNSILNLNQMFDLITEKCINKIKEQHDGMLHSKEYTRTINIYIETYTEYIRVSELIDIFYFATFDIIPFKSDETQKMSVISEMLTEKIKNRLLWDDFPNAFSSFDKLKCRAKNEYKITVTIKNNPQGVKL